MSSNTPGNSLRQRASGTVATPDQSRREPTVADLINAQKGEISRALPKYMDADRLARIVTTVVKQTPALARCDATSLLGAVMTCAQLGLEPGPLGEAWLVPYGTKVTFIPGYRGLIKLAWNSGRLQSIQAHVVHRADHFDYQYGLRPDLVHKPVLTGERGPVIAVYAAAVFKDGGNAFVVLSVDEVEALRKRGGGGRGGGPWTTDWDAMARKSAVRSLARWLPMATELNTFQQAAAMDGTVRSDYAAPLEAAQAVQPEAVGWAPEEQREQGPVERLQAAGRGDSEQAPAGVDPATGEALPVEEPPAGGDW